MKLETIKKHKLEQEKRLKYKQLYTLILSQSEVYADLFENQDKVDIQIIDIFSWILFYH